MKITLFYLFAVTFLAALVTFLLRAFPFLVFGSGKKPSPVIAFFGKVLSPAAIAMLCVYCFACYFRDRPPVSHGWGLAEIAASLVVILLQLWKKNPLLSILSGTAVYMILVQNFFP